MVYISLTRSSRSDTDYLLRSVDGREALCRQVGILRRNQGPRVITTAHAVRSAHDRENSDLLLPPVSLYPR